MALGLSHEWVGGVYQVRREGRRSDICKRPVSEGTILYNPDPFRTREVARPYVSPRVGIPELLVGPIPGCLLPHSRSATSALSHDLASALCPTLVIPTTTVMKGRSFVHSLLADPPKVKQEGKLTSKDRKTEDRFFANDRHILFISHTYSFTTTMGHFALSPSSHWVQGSRWYTNDTSVLSPKKTTVHQIFMQINMKPQSVISTRKKM